MNQHTAYRRTIRTTSSTLRCRSSKMQLQRDIAAMGRPRRPTIKAHAQPSQQQQQPVYPYNSGPGERKQKATIEHIFGGDASGGVDDGSSSASTSGSRPQAPWAVGWQMSERNLVWNDDLKMRLIRRVASEKLGLSEDELDARLEEVTVLLPDLRARLAQAPADMVVKLAGTTRAIAARLLRLRAAFPRADVSAMVSNRLGLLLDDDSELPEFEAAASRLQALLPGIDTDRFAEAFPAVLDVEDFEAALEDARRLMPGMDVPGMLRSNPDMVLSLMKGKHLISYDQIANPFTK